MSETCEEPEFECKRCGAIVRLPVQHRNEIMGDCEECGRKTVFVRKKQKYHPQDYFDDGRFRAKWLADDIQNHFHFATHEQSKQLFVYVNGVYVPKGEIVVKQEAKKRLQTEFKTHYVNETMEAIKIDNYVPYEKFENPRNCIACENGLLDPQEKEIKEFSPEHIHLTKIPVEYNPEADCPKIKQFLHEILHDEDIPLIQEMFGYCLLKDYPFAKAFMLLGSGANGKSTLLNLLDEFLGESNTAGVSLQQLLENRFSSVELFGKLANICADLSNKKLYETGKFKELTGRDPMRGERKHKDAFQFRNHAKLIYSANELPETDDKTEAFFRRWVIIEFPRQFLEDDPDTDPNILDKITSDEEMSGLLNWAIEGLNRLLEQGHFSKTKSRKDVQHKWIMQTDTLRAFLDKCCEFMRDCWIEKQCFMDAYKAFCDHNEAEAIKKGQVTHRLPSMKPIIQKYRPKLNGKRVLCWKNVKIKDSFVDDDGIFLDENGNPLHVEILQNDSKDMINNSTMSRMSQERITILSRSEREYEKDVEKRSDIPDTDKQTEKTCEESKFWQLIHNTLIEQKEPYEWHIDEIAEKLNIADRNDIRYLKEQLKEIALNDRSPVVSTNSNFTKYQYREE